MSGARSLLHSQSREELRLPEIIRDIPAQDLRYWNHYRREDYIVYQDWVGKIIDVRDEVTVRLGNGSAVTVEDPSDLEEHYWIPGTPSSELHQRLICSNFHLYQSKKLKRQRRAWGAEPCHPGQIVETKKGNLRRGRWKFGAYDPNVKPQGIVVDVRITQIEVSWLFPNIFKPHEGPRTPPMTRIGVDILESDAVKVYDHSKLPYLNGPSESSGASHSPDISFGHHVRFRDVAIAAVKYADGVDGKSFKSVPKIYTQGYDMNVLQIVETRTLVTIQWQDASTTVEESISLGTYFLVPRTYRAYQQTWRAMD